MLKAKIDCTSYPVVLVEAKERPAVPSLALAVNGLDFCLEIDPVVTSNRNFKHDFLLYFKEVEG